MVVVKVKRRLGHATLPEYAKPGDAGADIRARFSPNGNDFQPKCSIEPGETSLIDTGLNVEIPEGYELQVRPRSGLSKRGIIVPNSPGTIDSGYRGPLMVLIRNISKHKFTIREGDRIAQLVLKRAPQANFVEVDELSDSERGEGGFGSTGVK